MRLTTLALGVALLLRCVLAPQAARAADTEQVFERIRVDWARLESGFSYTARSFTRQLAVGEAERVRTGPGPRDFRNDIKRLRPVDARVSEYKIHVVIRGRTFWCSRTGPDDEVRYIVANESKVQDLNEEGEFFSVSERGKLIFDSAIKQPMFEPVSALDAWAVFPWPDEALSQGARIEVDAPEFAGDKCEATVRVWPKGSSDSGPAVLTRVFHFQKLPELGWLPTRIEIFAEGSLPVHQYNIVWHSVAASTGAVAVPVEYTLRSWGKDPESGQRLPVSEEGYVIDPASLSTRTEQSAGDPRWERAKLSSKPAQPQPLSATADDEWPLSRIYTFSFLFCVLAATFLLYLRYRQSRASAP